MGMNPEQTCFIAMGGNLGDVRSAFIRARNMLNELAPCRITDSSLLYRAPPMGPENQPDYLNAIIRLETTLSPTSLLETLQDIEYRLGRQRRERWGPRTLDLDIIACDDLIMDTPALTIPHAHMHER
ncbi:MAG: 2-amino-4-hydroxy-6-hydroxymethyldihydropteridine diphosphokinase, partial [Mariprofundaceae bacterium]|nr:2-amino-4-hydroxy-6-hydroxymethyldihydropteridine diphosphokinase [Mariprofundaceae bacterium]